MRDAPVIDVVTAGSGGLNVVQLVPRLATGGAERSALEIGAALVAAGHRSLIVCGGGPWVERAQAQGSEVIELPVGRKSPTTLLLVGKLRRLFTEFKADIVHARSRLPAWLSWFALKKMKPRPKFVTTVHGLNSVNAYSAIMLRGDAVIAVSETTRKHVSERYAELDPARVNVIPRGIDPSRYHRDIEVDPDWLEAFEDLYPALAGRPWLLLPGRGTRLKGHAEALNLMAELRARRLNIGLLMLGVVEEDRGRYLRELKHWASQLGVTDRVVFAPSEGDVRPFFRQSLAVLQLSTRPESFGRVVAEALAMRRPVLGYDHGGVGELLARHFEFGRVPLGRIEDLADRVEALLTGVNPALDDRLPRLGDMQRQTLEVYQRVLAS